MKTTGFFTQEVGGFLLRLSLYKMKHRKRRDTQI